MNELLVLATLAMSFGGALDLEPVVGSFRPGLAAAPYDVQRYGACTRTHTHTHTHTH